MSPLPTNEGGRGHWAGLPRDEAKREVIRLRLWEFKQALTHSKSEALPHLDPRIHQGYLSALRELVRELEEELAQA